MSSVSICSIQKSDFVQTFQLFDPCARNCLVKSSLPSIFPGEVHCRLTFCSLACVILKIVIDCYGRSTDTLHSPNQTPYNFKQLCGNRIAISREMENCRWTLSQKVITNSRLFVVTQLMSIKGANKVQV